MISLLFNRDFYDISNKTNKELAIRSIDSKLVLDGTNIGFVKGYIFDLKLIGGPTEEEEQLFKKQSDEKIFALYKEMGKLEEFKNMVRDGMTNILDFVDENDYEDFVEKNCFTESDYEDFLDEQDLEDVSQYAAEHRYVILINEIEIDDSSCNVSEIDVLDSIKETLFVILNVSDSVFIDSNYNALFKR